MGTAAPIHLLSKQALTWRKHKTKTIALKGMNNDLRLMISSMSCFNAVIFHRKHLNQNGHLIFFKLTFNLSKLWEASAEFRLHLSSRLIWPKSRCDLWPRSVTIKPSCSDRTASSEGNHRLKNKHNLQLLAVWSVKTLALGNFHFLFVTNGKISLPHINN